MPDAVAFRDQLVDWIYEKTNGNSTERIPILEFTKGVGLDLDGAYTLLWSCRDEGLLRDTSGVENPCGVLTSYGIADVRERRQRRNDPALRAVACRTGLLHWFYRQRISSVNMPVTGMPVTGRFAEDDQALHEGSRFTSAEIQDAAEYLSDKCLIKGVKADQLRGPVRAEITTDGIDCITDWEGNVSEYLRDQRGYGPTTFHGPVIHGNAEGGQWAWNNRDVTQNRYGAQQVAPGFKPLAEAVAELLKQLPAWGLAPHDQQDVEEVANEVLAEVVEPRPERRKLRKAGAALRGFLMPIAAGAAAGTSDEMRELAEQVIEHLSSAL